MHIELFTVNLCFDIVLTSYAIQYTRIKYYKSVYASPDQVLIHLWITCLIALGLFVAYFGNFMCIFLISKEEVDKYIPF